MPQRYKGTVRWFNPVKGYGFIQVPGRDKDLFVHRSGLDPDVDTLEENSAVEFSIVEGKKGPQAEAVVVL